MAEAAHDPADAVDAADSAGTSAVPVLLVDDDPDVLKASAQSLTLAGFAVETCADPAEALDRIEAGAAGVVVSDIRMPGIDGMELLRRAGAADAELPVILITGHGDVPLAVAAMREGAYDFLEKPFDADDLQAAVRRAVDKRRLVLELRRLSRHPGAEDPAAAIIGVSPATETLRQQVRALAEVDADVLIDGETGTGKELVARTLHRLSARAAKPFVAVNCGALPEQIVESELFGHEAGAFTSAVKRRIGKFEHADGGIVFLDEIESMPLTLQVRLLRVLQERAVERVGSNTQITIDVRIVAAAKGDLRAASEDGRFRDDLYYRLAVATLRVPPLRERGEDVPLLYAHFRALASARAGRPASPPEAARLARLAAHDWPGNVRELQNAAERDALDLPGTVTGAAGGSGGGGGGGGGGGSARDPAPAGDLPAMMDAHEKRLIEAVLHETEGSVARAHARLGIGRKTLYDKLQRHGIDPGRYRPAEG